MNKTNLPVEVQEAVKDLTDEISRIASDPGKSKDLERRTSLEESLWYFAHAVVEAATRTRLPDKNDI